MLTEPGLLTMEVLFTRSLHRVRTNHACVQKQLPFCSPYDLFLVSTHIWHP